MNLSRSMMLREQQRQRERMLANRAAEGHKPGDLVGVSKSQLVNSGLGVGERPSEYHCAYDCTVCKQRFVWDIRQPLTECPLCHAGPKQKPNKLPKKRITHKRARKLKAMAEVAAQNGLSGATFLNTPEELHAAGLITEDNMNELNETKEQEEARTEAARAAGTLIESGCTINTGIGAPTPDYEFQITAELTSGTHDALQSKEEVSADYYDEAVRSQMTTRDNVRPDAVSPENLYSGDVDLPPDAA